MALGLVTGALGAAKGIGGLFGGGGPRQPRMNRAQKKHLKSQTNLNNAMAQMMRKMSSMVGKMHQGQLGNRVGHPQGGCCKQGMNCASCHGGGGNHGFPQNPMGNLFGNQGFGQGGPSLNINLPAGMPLNLNLGGGGQNFFPRPGIGAAFGSGVNLRF